MNHLDLFSGIGGFSLAGSWVWGGEHNIVSFVEIDPFCQQVLKKHWPNVPIISDIGDCNGKDLPRIDILTGGFPCQPFSVAGKQGGKEDNRYLWPEMFRVISETHPTWIIAENVPGIIKMALDNVLSDLEGEGYSIGTFIIPACAINAPHRRDRIWIIAQNTIKSTHGGQETRWHKAINGDTSSTVRVFNRTNSHAENPNNWNVECRPSSGPTIRKEKDGQGPNNHSCRPISNAANSESREPRQSAKPKRRENTCRTNSNVANSTNSRPEGLREREDSVFQDASNSRCIRSTEQEQQTAGSEQCDRKIASNSNKSGLQRFRKSGECRNKSTTWESPWQEPWFEVATKLCGVDDGLPAELDGFKLTKSKHRIERLKSLGNAIVPQVVAELMWMIKEIEESA